MPSTFSIRNPPKKTQRWICKCKAYRLKIKIMKPVMKPGVPPLPLISGTSLNSEQHNRDTKGADTVSYCIPGLKLHQLNVWKVPFLYFKGRTMSTARLKMSLTPNLTFISL